MASRDPVSDAELFDRYSGRGDRRARDELVARHLPLARSVARRYARSPDEREDLAQVASVGLVLAVDRFDPSRGTAFSSYAVPTIVGELKRHLRDSGWALHLPRSLKERVLLVERTTRTLTARSGRAPTVAELANESGLTEEAVLDALAARSTHATEALPPEPGGSEDPELARIADRDALGRAAENLGQREREVVLMRFALDLTQTEIAERLEISQAQVSRVLRRALDELRA